MGRPHHVYIGHDCKGAILAMFTLGMTINGHPCNVYFGYDLFFKYIGPDGKWTIVIMYKFYVGHDCN